MVPGLVFLSLYARHCAMSVKRTIEDVNALRAEFKEFRKKTRSDYEGEVASLVQGFMQRVGKASDKVEVEFNLVVEGFMEGVEHLTGEVAEGVKAPL